MHTIAWHISSLPLVVFSPCVFLNVSKSHRAEHCVNISSDLTVYQECARAHLLTFLNVIIILPSFYCYSRVCFSLSLSEHFMTIRSRRDLDSLQLVVVVEQAVVFEHRAAPMSDLVPRVTSSFYAIIYA